ncbi:hypothetical protein FHS89_000209 [Rubricella aquisinus]|uniref:CENP-V/GFA domain-containing protein n=1 Tax=Rubricella aquisinus TaxID=2028108 RepID=A0A840WI99_9RHOB|nr:GFA family protein [Rubricella aquisinus]MBB5514211.1 hypothetical protein [Rubricella aquisinus]
MASKPHTGPLTGRCYCGAIGFEIDAAPQTAAYCHCTDCRRLTGAPVAAFAAFAAADVTYLDAATHLKMSDDVERWHCGRCGSALASWFSYLPDQIYVPLGVLDAAGSLAPTVHCHADSALPWLHIADDLPRVMGSAREVLHS